MNDSATTSPIKNLLRAFLEWLEGRSMGVCQPGSPFELPLDAATVRRGPERVPSHGTMAARPADSPPAEGAFPPEDAPFRERP